MPRKSAETNEETDLENFFRRTSKDPRTDKGKTGLTNNFSLKGPVPALVQLGEK